MLKFIETSDFALPQTYRYNEDGSVAWIYTTQEATHSGVIFNGLTRTGADDNVIDVWANLLASGVSIEPYPLDNIKAAAKQQIDAQRDSFINGGVVYNGHTFQTDAQSIMDIMGAVLAAVDTQWLTKDNVVVPMTVADMQALGGAVAAHKEFYVYRARQHKDAIDALTDKTAIDAYMAAINWGVN
jgi:uncharacterized protein YfiM (DUF2279 family)